MALFRALLREATPPATRESTALDLTLPDGGALPLLQVRDRRTRRLRLTVSERGVRLSVPWRLPQNAADTFVQEHLGWIAAQWARLGAGPEAVSWTFGALEALPLLGADRPVDWVEARAVRLERAASSEAVADEFIEASPASIPLRFHAPRGASAASLRRALREFYAAEARTAVHRWLPRYLPGLPRAPAGFRFRPLRSLWGSLAPDGQVSLDLALVLGPAPVFEYVLVHELCHLIHAHHAPSFWAEVEARCPDWRSARAFLRADAGLGLKGRLRALSGG